MPASRSRSSDTQELREVKRALAGIFRELSGFELPPRPPMVRRNGPPPDMARAVRAWLGGLAIGAVLWCGIIWLACALLGCATGRIVRDDVEITCAAIGESARVTYSVPQGEAGIIVSAPTQLIACEGGAIIPSLLDGVGTVVKALFSWIVL